MHWHAETTLALEIQDGPGSWLKVKTLALRGFFDPTGFERHQPFDAILSANVFEVSRRAFLYGFNSRSGEPLGRQDYRALSRLLRGDFGVSLVTSDRHGAPSEMDTERWAA